MVRLSKYKDPSFLTSFSAILRKLNDGREYKFDYMKEEV
jgi:hypothetical protein